MTETREASAQFRRNLTRNLALPLGMGLGSVIVFVVLLLKLADLLEWVDHTHRVIAKGQELSTLLADEESGMRGFLISGQESFLAPYSLAQAKFGSELQAGKALTTDNPAQHDRLRRVGALAERWDAYASDVIAMRRRGEPVEPVVRTERGKQMFDEIRRELRAFIDTESRLLSDRREDAQNGTWLAVGGYITLLLGVSVLIAWAGRRDIINLSSEYGTAMARMRASGRESEERAWLRGAQLELANQLAGELAARGIAERTLGYLAERSGAIISAAFVRGDDGRPQRIATHGLRDEDEARGGARSDAEHGLVGQVWRDGAMLRLPGLKADFLKIATHLGDTSPQEVLLLPALHEGRVNGLLELGFAQPPDARTLALLEQLQGPLGTLLEAASYRQRLQRSLEETRQLNEELQVQQEELRTANEELSEQSRVLSESQLQLEEQRAELEQTNVQLGEQSETLSRRNAALNQVQAELQDRATELQRASRYKSEFLANMSHELRTPLNSSLILSKLLADNKPGNLSEEQLRFANTIHSAGKDLLTLINDILDLSKVEAGKLDISPRPMPLRALADGMRRVFEPLAHDKRLGFHIHLEAGLPDAIVSDSQRVEQVLRNLLSNAIKFTEQGAVTLHIEPRTGGVAFVVKDTGIGIPASQQQRVFEAFHQGDGALNRRYGGTGLGLSISRQLAGLLGGDIELSSVEGEGSQFTLRLPLQMPVAPTPPELPVLAPAPPLHSLTPPSPSAREAATAAPPAFADDRAELDTPIGVDAPPRRLALVVEDDPTFAAILYDLAHEMQYRCIVATQAREALALASTHLPQAILLDVRLPDGSGLAVLQRLKEDPRTRHIPVHVIAGEDFRDVALPLGAVGTAIKPTTREELIEIFRKLERHGADEVRRLLLVEDDPRQRDSIAQLIGDDGIEVVAVGLGEEALAQLEAQPFDCMIIDLKLPDMDGTELLARMAARGPDAATPPVIVYTGRSLSRDEEVELNRYSRTIIIKGARSPERLLDEVTLFLHRVESRMRGEHRDMLRTARNREQIFEGRKVLLVDDDVRNVFAMTSLLEQRGLAVEPARNGVEALEKLETHSDIDLVLMDVMMPVMDGLEATRRIRADLRWHKLPVIAITAKAMRDDQEQCRKAGANDYLAKPIELDRLMSLLRVWLPGAI